MKFDETAYMLWLRENTNLQERSIWLYCSVAKRFLRLYELNQGNLKRFVKESSRDNNSNYTKFAMKYYLQYVNKLELYAQIPTFKQKPRKKIPSYLPQHIRDGIIKGITDEKYQDMAMIQDATGARAFEIVTIREEKVDIQIEKDIIRLQLEVKGGTYRMAFLDKKKFLSVLNKYFKKKMGYLFLDRDIEELDTTAREKIITSNTLYYERAIKESAVSLGHDNFTSHDFRRNMVDEILEATGDIIKARDAAGHKSIQTTEKYLKDRSENYKDIMITRQKQ